VGRFTQVSFDVSADAYMRFMGQYSERLAARFADLAGIHRGQRVLDVGCGPGALATEVPVAGTAAVAEHRGGMFTMSPDGRFVAGPVPDLPGLWVASGCNGSGFSSSQALGEALAAWIASGGPPPGMTALAPGRFGPLPDDALIARGLWQYAHYYDPAPA